MRSLIRYSKILQDCEIRKKISSNWNAGKDCVEHGSKIKAIFLRGLWFIKPVRSRMILALKLFLWGFGQQCKTMLFTNLTDQRDQMTSWRDKSPWKVKLGNLPLSITINAKFNQFIIYQEYLHLLLCSIKYDNLIKDTKQWINKTCGFMKTTDSVNNYAIVQL